MATQVYVMQDRLFREYQLAATTTATTALAIAFPTDNNDTTSQPRMAILRASGADVIFNFGNSAVVASKTVDGTTKRLPDGNFSVVAGAIYIVRLNQNDQNYVSVITPTGSGTAYITLTTPLI